MDMRLIVTGERRFTSGEVAQALGKVLSTNDRIMADAIIVDVVRELEKLRVHDEEIVSPLPPDYWETAE
jgi:hypothetical protein